MLHQACEGQCTVHDVELPYAHGRLPLEIIQAARAICRDGSRHNAGGNEFVVVNEHEIGGIRLARDEFGQSVVIQDDAVTVVA